MAGDLQAQVNKKSPFAKKIVKHLVDFSGGKNDKFNPLLLADNELTDVQNMNYDEKGTLQKRNGYTARYASTFATGPVRGLVNYRKEDGTSRLVIAADDKWFYDKPQFSQLYQAEADFETTGTYRNKVDTATTANTVKPIGMGLGAAGLGSRQVQLGGAKVPAESTWRTQSLDISGVQDKTTGTVTIQDSVPTGTTITVETRVSPDNVTWDAWTPLGVSNAIQSVGTRIWLQARVRFDSTNRMKASMTSFNVKFDQTPTVTTIGGATGMSTSVRWCFRTMNDTLYGVNGTDTNKKWDGTTFGTQAGSPPTCQYVEVNKQRMFLAGQPSSNRSRLYFSDLANPESWPVLNFLDVGRGDGDAITGLAVLNDNLVITKDHSVWILQGDSPTNFVLRRMTDETGSTTGLSFGGGGGGNAIVKQILPILARDGVYFFDGVRTALASEKITNTLLGCNQRELTLAAGISVGVGYTRKYWLSLPEGAATHNTLVVVFDSLRSAWTVYRGMNASEFCLFRQFNADTLVFGDSTKGQVYNAEQTGFNDDGAAIDAYFVTKALDMEGPEVLRNARRVFIDGQEPQGQATTASVSFFKDLGTESNSVTLNFVNPLEVRRAIPGAVGLASWHSLAIKVRHNTVNQGFKCFGVLLEFVNKGLRPTGS